MKMIPMGKIDEDGNIDGKSFSDWFDEANVQIEGASADRWDRDRPYNGQPHTTFGERGQELVIGLTMRDLMDCFAQGLLFCCGVDQPELYAIADRALHENLYDVNLEHIDPGAWWQNMACQIERMMGIYPNVPRLRAPEDEDG